MADSTAFIPISDLVGVSTATAKNQLQSASVTNLKFELKLFGQCIVMCNEEREQIKSMPMGLPKRLKMTQNQVNVAYSIKSPNDKPLQVSMDLDHFSLYSSHIILLVEGAHGTTSIQNAELKLNSSSFAGVLEGPLLTGPAGDSLELFSNGFYVGGMNATNNYYIFPLASQAYGGSSVPLNRFDNIRLDLSIVSGLAATFPTSQDAGAITVKGIEHTADSEDFVPYLVMLTNEITGPPGNKFTISFAVSDGASAAWSQSWYLNADGKSGKSLVVGDATMHYPLESVTPTGASAPTVTVDSTFDYPLTITATCVGETTALYKNGAASLAMY